jgi:hypothetical protein
MKLYGSRWLRITSVTDQAVWLTAVTYYVGYWSSCMAHGGYVLRRLMIKLYGSRWLRITSVTDQAVWLTATTYYVGYWSSCMAHGGYVLRLLLIKLYGSRRLRITSVTDQAVWLTATTYYVGYWSSCMAHGGYVLRQLLIKLYGSRRLRITSVTDQAVWFTAGVTGLQMFSPPRLLISPLVYPCSPNIFIPCIGYLINHCILSSPFLISLNDGCFIVPGALKKILIHLLFVCKL